MLLCDIIKDYSRSQRGPPPWMVKSSTGTDEATPPMWFRFSSVRPVEGQLMDFGCPSRVKKPAEDDSSTQRQRTRT